MKDCDPNIKPGEVFSECDLRGMNQGAESELGMMKPVYDVFAGFTNLGTALYGSTMRATMKASNDAARTSAMMAMDQ